MKIIQPAQIQFKTVRDIMAVKIPKELLPMEGEDWSFFLDLKQVKSLKIKTLDLKTLQHHKKLRRYYLIEKTLLNKFLTRNGWDNVIGQTDSLKALRDPFFDPQRLFYPWRDAHLLYKFREEYPLSPTYDVGYIGGVTERDYDLDKAQKILRNDSRVSNVRLMEIPYYNQNPECKKACAFSVRLLQEEHDKLVHYYRDEKKEEFWSCRVKDSLATSYFLAPFDVLGLQAALKVDPAVQDLK